MHITQLGMKFRSLFNLDFILIDRKCNSNTHPFVLIQKNLEIFVALGLRKVTIVQKLSNLVHLGYFS